MEVLEEDPERKTQVEMESALEEDPGKGSTLEEDPG